MMNTTPEIMSPQKFIMKKKEPVWNNYWIIEKDGKGQVKRTVTKQIAWDQYRENYLIEKEIRKERMEENFIVI